MPEAVKKYYEWFINSWPESWHPTTLDFLYLFLGVLLRNSKKIRSQEWFEENLREDCPKLSEEDIQKYGDIYQHIRDFKKFPKSQTAKLIAKSIFEENTKKTRKKYGNKQ
ncbi:MAG: hypothetical protein ACTSQY_10910 [Candidatus Odinarchaeia archaeon]